jgi:hypothetical protein
MNRTFRGRLTGAVGAVMVLASVGGLAIILVISGGSGITLARNTTPSPSASPSTECP